MKKRALEAFFRNIIPIFGILFFGWSFAILLLFYFLEVLILTLFTLLKVATNKKDPASLSTIGCFLPLFFFTPLFIYGVFIIVLPFITGDSLFELLSERSIQESLLMGLSLLLVEQISLFTKDYWQHFRYVHDGEELTQKLLVRFAYLHMIIWFSAAIVFVTETKNFEVVGVVVCLLKLSFEVLLAVFQEKKY